MKRGPSGSSRSHSRAEIMSWNAPRAQAKLNECGSRRRNMRCRQQRVARAPAQATPPWRGLQRQALLGTMMLRTHLLGTVVLRIPVPLDGSASVPVWTVRPLRRRGCLARREVDRPSGRRRPPLFDENPNRASDAEPTVRSRNDTRAWGASQISAKRLRRKASASHTRACTHAHACTWAHNAPTSQAQPRWPCAMTPFLPAGTEVHRQVPKPSLLFLVAYFPLYRHCSIYLPVVCASAARSNKCWLRWVCSSLMWRTAQNDHTAQLNVECAIA